MDWKQIQDAYPVNREWVWLNNCGITPPGNHIVEAMSRYMNGYAREVVMSPEADADGIRRRIKAILSELLGCGPDELCLIRNTSEGMNLISHGLSFQEGDEAILLENEYPSNVYPWRSLEMKGVKLVTAPAENTPARFLASLKERVNSNTRMISVSAVHWCTGMPLPLMEIGELCREKGIFFTLDGAQGAGLIPIDVKAMNIHFMAFSAWKWLMGPLGLGVFYVDREKLDRINPIFMGTESVVRDEEYLPYKDELKPDADRFGLSTSSLGDWVYFLSSLQFLHKIGFSKVQARIYELTEYLTQRLQRIGFQVFSENFPDSPTGVAACERAGVSSGNLVKRIREQKVFAVERLGRVRFSPHIFNSEHGIDAAVRILSEACVKEIYAQTARGGK